jgi:hypothetical protein
MARLVRNGNVENVQDDYSFDLGFFFFFVFCFFSNNPFGPITTNERTNERHLVFTSRFSILFYSSIHPTYPIPIGFSVFFCFFFSVHWVDLVHPSIWSGSSCSCTHRLSAFPCRFLYPPSTDVLVNYIRKSSLSIVFFMPHTYYRFILPTCYMPLSLFLAKIPVVIHVLFWLL